MRAVPALGVTVCIRQVSAPTVTSPGRLKGSHQERGGIKHLKTQLVDCPACQATSITVIQIGAYPELRWDG